jgi:Holliday junction resolvase RusA-like endonuclease
MSGINFISMAVPWPVSVNAMYTYIPALRRPGKSAQYQKYEKSIYKCWLEARALGRIDMRKGPLCFWAFAFPPRINCDMDNIQKVLFDCLESAGAFSNDCQIESIRIEKGFRVSGGAVYFHLCAMEQFWEMAPLFERQKNLATQLFHKIQKRHPFGSQPRAR